MKEEGAWVSVCDACYLWASVSGRLPFLESAHFVITPWNSDRRLLGEHAKVASVFVCGSFVVPGNFAVPGNFLKAQASVRVGTLRRCCLCVLSVFTHRANKLTNDTR